MNVDLVDLAKSRSRNGTVLVNTGLPIPVLASTIVDLQVALYIGRPEKYAKNTVSLFCANYSIFALSYGDLWA